MTRIEGVDQWNAMVNADGDWFYPDSPNDAAVFAITHGAGFYHDLEATEHGATFKADTARTV